MHAAARRIGALTLAAGAAMTAAGCAGGQGSPEDLGASIESIMNDKDYGALARLTCSHDKKKVDKYNVDKQMAKAGITHVQYSVDFVGASKAKHDKSVLTFTVTWENMPKQLAGMKDTQDQRIPVKDVDGKWVVCSK